MTAVRALALCAAASIAAALIPAPALAVLASATVTIPGPRPAIAFTSNNITNPALPANTSIAAQITVTTSPVGGGGQLAISSPPSPIGTFGTVLNLSKITATCNLAPPPAASWFTNGSATLVSNGQSGACATFGSGVTTQNANVTISFTLDARSMPADTWGATSGFSLVASAF